MNMLQHVTTFLIAYYVNIQHIFLISACNSGWTSFGHTGYCYQYFPTLKSWNASRRFCQSVAPPGKQGDLASVGDHFTNNFLSSLTSKDVWIGGYKDAIYGWSWSDGTRWRYNAWSRGKPNNGGGNQHHLAFNFQSSLGDWNDANVNTEKGFICEYTGIEIYLICMEIVIHSTLF